jgi:hypothetical protein
VRRRHEPHPGGRWHTVISTDLVDRGYGRGGRDFLADHETVAEHTVTNPPYSPPRGLAAKFVEHALSRIRPGGTVCMLLPDQLGSRSVAPDGEVLSQAYLLASAGDGPRRLHRQKAPWTAPPWGWPGCPADGGH